MTEEKQYWSIEDLESLTETVQEAEIEYQGKHLKMSWCELTESEEPKALVVDETLPEEETNEQFMALAREKTRAMMVKAQEKQPDTSVITPQVYEKLPTNLKFLVSNKILGVSDPNEQ